MLARYVPALAFVPKFSRMRWQSEVILRREAQFLCPDGEIAQHRCLRLMRGDHLPLFMNFLRRELDHPFLLGLVIEKLASFEIAAPRMIRSHLKAPSQKIRRRDTSAIASAASASVRRVRMYSARDFCPAGQNLWSEGAPS